MTNQKPIRAFWGEMSASEHFVQIYENDANLLDTLAEFTAGGLQEGHASVVIATPAHRLGLATRLTAMGIDVTAAEARDQFISLDAEKTMEKFMVNGWPDPDLFHETITEVLERGASGGRQVRAFGEMVALMWEKGQNAAVVRLEQLWTDLCNKERFSLFCAYPRPGFTEKAEESIAHVCALHSKVLTG